MRPLRELVVPLVAIACLVLGCHGPTRGGPDRAPELFVHTPDLVSDFEHHELFSAVGDSRCRVRGFVAQLEHTSFRDPSTDEQVPVAGAEPAVLEAFRESISLLRVRDGARVSVDVRESCVDLDGTDSGPVSGAAVSLVPREPLEDGWYVFRVDIAAIEAAGLPIAGSEEVAFARVRWGSALSWTTTIVSRDVDSWIIGGELSEPVAEGFWPTPSFEVRYAGEPVSCTSGDTEIGFGGVCPIPPEGTEIEIELLAAGINTPSGAPLSVQQFSYADALAADVDGNGSSSLPVEPDFAMELALRGAP